MANFPETFTEPLYLHPTDISATFAETFIELKKRELVVVVGLQPSDLPALKEITNQKGALEFCPNDINRWADEPTAELQLAKDGGRGVLRLESYKTGETAVFGWVGKSSEDERKFLPDCENTYAIRVNEKFQRQGLGKLATQAFVAAAGSKNVFGAKRIGLETWAGNVGAVKAYLGANATLVTLSNAIRPTLDESYPIDKDKDSKLYGKHVLSDTRLYMQFPWSF